MLKEAKNKIRNEKKSQQKKPGYKDLTQSGKLRLQKQWYIFCNGYFISSIVIVKLKKEFLNSLRPYLGLQVTDSLYIQA